MAATNLKRIGAYAGFIGHVALSIVFFSVFAIFLGFFNYPYLPYFGSNIFAAVFFAFGMISFLGGALFLYVTADAGMAWNYRIPLVGLAAVITLSSFLSPALQTRGVLAVLPGLGLVMAMAGSYAIVLLAPAAVLFFHSLRPIRRSDIGIHVVLSLGVSLVSALLFLGLLLQTGGPLHPYPEESGYGLWFWIYLAVGMPLVGAFVLASSAKGESAGVDAGREERVYENP
jgi:hypothetical protein